MRHLPDLSSPGELQSSGMTVRHFECRLVSRIGIGTQVSRSTNRNLSQDGSCQSSSTAHHRLLQTSCSTLGAANYMPLRNRTYSDMWSTLMRIRTRWLFCRVWEWVSARQALSLNVSGSWGFAKEPQNRIAPSARWNGAQLFGAFVSILERKHRQPLPSRGSPDPFRFIAVRSLTREALLTREPSVLRNALLR